MANISDEQRQVIDGIKDFASKNGKGIADATKEYLNNDGNRQGIANKFGGNIATFYLAMAQEFPGDADKFKAMAAGSNRYFVNSLDKFFERLRNMDDRAHYACNVFMQSRSARDKTPTPVKFKQGTLSYIGARTGRGKTTAMLSIAMDALHQGKRVYFYTNEETTDQIIMRAIRAQYFFDNVDDNGNIGHTIDDDDWTACIKSHPTCMTVKATNTANGSTIQVNAQGIAKAIATIESMMAKKQFTIIDGLAQRAWADIPASLAMLDAGDVVLLDYIQHIRKPSTQEMGGGAADYKALQFASQSIADIAAMNDLIVIAGAQLNRNATSDDKGTAIDDNQAPDKLGEQYFRESGDLEQDADTIIQIGRQELANGQPVKRFYKIIKHRGCPQDSTIYAINDNAAYSIYGCVIVPDPMGEQLQKFIAADYKGTKAKATSNGGKAHAWNSPHGNDDGGTVIDDDGWGV